MKGFAISHIDQKGGYVGLFRMPGDADWRTLNNTAGEPAIYDTPAEAVAAAGHGLAHHLNAQRQQEPQPLPITAVTLEGGLATSVCTNRADFFSQGAIVLIDFDTDGYEEADLSDVFYTDGRSERAYVLLPGLESAAIDLPRTLEALNEH